MENYEELHKKALQVAIRFRRAESDLILVFQEVDHARAFDRLGFTSLFEYSVKALGLSEAVTANFITVARKGREVPELTDAIVNGEISVSKARKITPVLTPENQAEWLNKAKVLSTRSLEEEVARLNPAAAIPERMRFVSEGRLELRTGISKDLQEKLRRAQDLESQRLGRAASLEETLEALADTYLRKNDPILRAVKRKADAPARVTVTRKLPSRIRVAVIKRDQGQCTHHDERGERCGSRRWIDVHHIIPRSEGGADTLENLTVLCKAHHRFEHPDQGLRNQAANIKAAFPGFSETSSETR